jgi:hypothetical protein
MTILLDSSTRRKLSLCGTKNRLKKGGVMVIFRTEFIGKKEFSFDERF